MGGAHRGENPGAAWPSIPAVLRVMAGWFLVGVGVLNLAVEVDGGLTNRYVIFHVVLPAGGAVLLMRHRFTPSRAGYVIAGLAAGAGLAVSTVPATSHCCLAQHPRRHGWPYPFLGSGDGVHVDAKYLAVALVFWSCVGLLLLAVIARVERMLPERRTPVDLAALTGGHAEAHAMTAIPDRRDQNVGGLT